LTKTPDLKNFCYLFCKYIAWLLDSLERRERGEKRDFSNKLNMILRKYWWLNNPNKEPWTQTRLQIQTHQNQRNKITMPP